MPNKWAVFSSILFGVGSIFKIYPLLLLPPIALIIGKQWRQRLVSLCIGCSIFGISSLLIINTPVYVNSVLLNPEGTKIFREIQLFGLSVSPFIIGYLILLGYLSIGSPPDRFPQMAWLISLIVLALLFLWVPAPFYWLIWITPFLIGVVDRTPKMLYAWVLLQFTFALMLLSQHKELSVALPIHLTEMYNIPNLPTALVLTQPVLYKIFITLLPFVNSCLAVSLLFIIWCSRRALFQGLHPYTYNLELHPLVGIVFPTTVMLLILTTNLFFSKDLVGQSNWGKWQNLTLATGDFVIQKLSPEHREITGVRIRFVEATPSATLKLCLYRNGDIHQEPFECVSRNTDEQVENRVLFFIFDTKVSIENHDSPTLSLQIEDVGATIVLPYTTSIKKSLQFNQTRLMGSLDLSTLSSFSIADAFDKLIIQNILNDPALSLAIGIVTTLVGLFLGVLFLKFHAPSA